MSCGDMTAAEGWNIQLQHKIRKLEAVIAAVANQAQAWRDRAFGSMHMCELKSDVLEDCAGEIDEILETSQHISAGMGPIEKALRERNYLSAPIGQAPTHIYGVYAGARAELKRRGMVSPRREDIESEAIEAAAALGL